MVNYTVSALSYKVIYKLSIRRHKVQAFKLYDFRTFVFSDVLGKLSDESITHFPVIEVQVLRTFTETMWIMSGLRRRGLLVAQIFHFSSNLEGYFWDVIMDVGGHCHDRWNFITRTRRINVLSCQEDRNRIKVGIPYFRLRH